MNGARGGNVEAIRRSTWFQPTVLPGYFGPEELQIAAGRAHRPARSHEGPAGARQCAPPFLSTRHPAHEADRLNWKNRTHFGMMKD